MKRPILIILLVLIADQALKIYIKTHFAIGEEYRIAPWFIIHFTENNGMAFGMQFGGQAGKIVLSLFRIIVAVATGWYLRDITIRKMHPGFIASIALIFAGAVGNIIDSAFYGLIFSDSGYYPAKFMAPGSGYAGFLHGKVVDMLYFPLIEGHFPSWFPFWGGEEFIFFRPVFNLSDASISVGVALFLIFQKKYYPSKPATVTSPEASGNHPPDRPS
ncbi:MAG: lipoprotein signal peptidase [Bacteroidia bacterium]|nr:lipoprotein signal peptidase [Bacteroidia bacterium]